MNSTQAYLLEIMVNRLGIREKPRIKSKSVGFEGDQAALVSTAAETSSKNLLAESMKTRGLTLYSVAVTVPGFQRFLIQEDLTISGASITDDVIEEKTIEGSDKELEERKLARAAGLSYREYKDSKNKNPNLMNERRFKRGRTFLFRSTPKEMTSLLKAGPVNICVRAEGDPRDIGKTSIEFPNSFAESVAEASRSSAMREQMNRVGPIWWPSQHYRKQMFKDVREAQRLERERKKMLTQEEQDLVVRFGNLLKLKPLPKECNICCADDPCNPIGANLPCLEKGKVPKGKRKKLMKIDRKGDAWLMYPSPEPIKPPALPVVAETTEVCDIVNDKKSQTAVLSLFVRLSCFGNALEIDPTIHRHF